MTIRVKNGVCVLVTDTLDYWQLQPKVLTSEQRGKRVCSVLKTCLYSSSHVPDVGMVCKNTNLYGTETDFRGGGGGGEIWKKKKRKHQF